jgi:hypothetical protein
VAVALVARDVRLVLYIRFLAYGSVTVVSTAACSLQTYAVEIESRQRSDLLMRRRVSFQSNISLSCCKSFHANPPIRPAEQNAVDVVDVPDSAGFVVSSKAVYSIRKHGVVARSAARTCLPSLVPALVLNLTGK